MIIFGTTSFQMSKVPAVSSTYRHPEQSRYDVCGNLCKLFVSALPPKLLVHNIPMLVTYKI